MTIAPLAELLIFGILLGGIYGLSAIGLTLIFGVARVLNLAHGAFAVIAAAVSYVIVQATGQNLFFVAMLTVPLFFATGYAYEKLLIHKLLPLSRERRIEALILGTLGSALAAESIASIIVPRNFGLNYQLPPISLGEITVSALRLLLLVIVAVTTITLHLIIYKTWYGKALRATIDDAEAAQLMGVNFDRVASVTFGLGTALSALGGILLLLVSNISPTMGFPVTLKVLTIIILGGLGSVLGSLAAAIVLGLSEIFTGFFFDTAWANSTSLVVLLIVLLIKSEGLLKR
ncbi:MAG: branched-chain amino acid ABC transporter permease [Thaumarchaeota archaeon]|nr:branched-chain amino acid ABC transporter permease [Nitrososphaerota archaeon]